MENKEIEAVAVLGEKRQSGLEGRSREEQPPGRVLFTLEDLKPLSRGKLRTNWKERRGNRTRGERGAREGETGRRAPTGNRPGPGARAWPGEGWGPKRGQKRRSRS